MNDACGTLPAAPRPRSARRLPRLLPRLLLGLLLASPAAAQQPAPGPSRSALAPGSYAVTGVTVIPMTGRGVIRDGAVLVRDGRIAAVGELSRVPIPPGTRRIDGRGGFLIPGLADMHTHLYSDGEVPDSAGPHELGVMLAHGITAARLMIGTPEHLALRRAVAEGRVAGPQLWLAGPQLAGKDHGHTRVVASPADVPAAVREIRAAGYDFLKLTTDISRPVYDAVVEEAARAGLRVTGHVDGQVGLPRALAAGQQIEHLDGYFEAALADSAPSRESVTQYGAYRPESWASLDHVDDGKLVALARRTAEAGVWSTPTLHVFNSAFALRETDERMRAREDFRRMIPPAVRELYLRSRARYRERMEGHATPGRRARYVEVRNRLTREIVRAGGRVMAGSDSPELLFAYGWGLHYELEALVEAGLTPYQALEAATRTPAEFLRAGGEWGTIEPGKRADLVLLAADPLRDIRHTRRIEAVAVGGRWLPRADLDALVRAGSRAIDGDLPG